ncbi:uncharacterized protein LOC132402596 isoform X1 [Hypanus sabinus]|uniref:uncharacterized protein LOC132402596 isoform X1 n=2 Tax=Hypanus sabinus TaxID=79690 RepID=UPI0028C3FEAD|nr:uncharacterized protein LOC132402596 isoform X1 [Hypanus sabinus]
MQLTHINPGLPDCTSCLLLNCQSSLSKESLEKRRITMATQECKIVATIKKAERSITKASDVREDNALMLQPYSNWEQFLMPGPLSIAILGEIIFLSAGEDFTIDKMVPNGGFQYMKYPKSFRASLVQVSNEGWEAFQEAHKNMDQIRLLTVNIPTDMRDVVKFLMQKDPKVTEAFLPIPLNSIKSTADKCLKLSSAVEDKFTGVICLINELLEACTSSKGVYEQELHEIKIKKELTEMKEKAAREAKAMVEEHHKKLESQLKQAQEDYKANMDSMPVGWNAVAMSMAETTTKAVSLFITGGVLKVLAVEGCKAVGKAAGSLADKLWKSDPNNVGEAENNIINKAETLGSFIQILYPFQIEDLKIDLKKLNSEDEIKKLHWCKQQLVKFQEEARNGGDCPEKVAALKICETAIGICVGLENLQTSKPDAEVMADLAVKIRQVMRDTMTFTSCCKAKAGIMGVTATPPHMSQTEPAEELSGLQTASLNARIKVEQSSKQLQAAQEMYERSFENIQKNNEELQEVLETLKSCNVQEIDFDKTVKMLLKGLDALGRVKEQWGKMVLFFTMISNLIECSLNPSLHKFIQYSEKTSSGYSQNQLIQDMLYTEISQATNISSLVHMIAETYVQVSTQHLMDRVNSLGKLMGLDPNRDRIKFEKERTKFGSDCKAASEAIEDLVKKNKEHYKERVQARIDRIKNTVMPLLPPATAEEIKEIEDAVQAGTQAAIEEKSKEDLDQFA